jgi:hypothetical protein
LVLRDRLQRLATVGTVRHDAEVPVCTQAQFDAAPGEFLIVNDERPYRWGD